MEPKWLVCLFTENRWKSKFRTLPATGVGKLLSQVIIAAAVEIVTTVAATSAAVATRIVKSYT